MIKYRKIKNTYSYRKLNLSDIPESPHQPLTAQLTIDSSVGGETIPAVGIYQKEIDEVVPLYASPSDGFAFVNWLIGGVVDLKQLTAIKMSRAKSVVAQFIASGFQTILKTFHTAPVNKGDKYYFGDYSGNDNDVECKGSRVGTFGATQYVNSLINLVGENPFEIKIKLNINSIGAQKILFICGGANTEKGITIQLTATNILQMYISNGTNRQTWNINSIALFGNTDINITWNGLIGGTITAIINNTTYSVVATHKWDGNSRYQIILGWPSSSINSIVYYFKINNSIEWVINHGQGATIYDISGNGNNGTVTGAVLETFWGSTSDEAEPYDLTKGATLYKNDSDNTIMPICFDTNQVISGFTRLGWFPAGSGILKGLPNKYNLVGNSEVPQGDYTADEIAVFTNSEIVEVTQNANAVTQLILKS